MMTYIIVIGATMLLLVFAAVLEINSHNKHK